MLAQLAEGADYVVVSSPPLLPYNDTLRVLARHTDGVIMVATARRTRRRQLADGAAKLRRVGAPALGVVLDRGSAAPTRTKPRSAGSMSATRRPTKSAPFRWPNASGSAAEHAREQPGMRDRGEVPGIEAHHPFEVRDPGRHGSCVSLGTGGRGC